jgi:hypothetical protein
VLAHLLCDPFTRSSLLKRPILIVMKNQEFLVLLDARIEEIARAVFLECNAASMASAQPSDDAAASCVGNSH